MNSGLSHSQSKCSLNVELSRLKSLNDIKIQPPFDINTLKNCHY